MIIGVPKELKNHEYRVGLTPKAVETLAKSGHWVSIESKAGLDSGFSDKDFIKAGALITNSRFVWLGSDIIVKVKEPLPEETRIYPTLKIDWHKKNPESKLIVFAFFHFPANPMIKKFVFENEIKAVPYENIQLADGSRPVLAEMSKIAAEVSVDAASHYLRKENGGKGKLLKDAMALIIGCEGNLGKTACNILLKRGARVIGFDRKEILNHILETNGSLKKEIASPENLFEAIPGADIVICAAATKGEGAPKLITHEMLKLMQPGSIIVDPSIDEGGCCETSRPTTHDNPIFIENNIIHYCVSNMPGVVPRSSTPALVEKTLPYILEVANKGWGKALAENEILAQTAKI